MLGRAKCKILKEIRQKIADENEIPYVTRECTYQGNCSGTCPRCESELRYLERELEARTRIGKKVAVTALCAGIAMGSSACANPLIGQDLGGAAELRPEDQRPTVSPDQDLAGAGEPPDDELIELSGEAEPGEEIIELSGDVEALPVDLDLAGAAEMWEEGDDGCVSDNSVSDNAVPTGAEDPTPEAEN